MNFRIKLSLSCHQSSSLGEPKKTASEAVKYYYFLGPTVDSHKRPTFPTLETRKSKFVREKIYKPSRKICQFKFQTASSRKCWPNARNPKSRTYNEYSWNKNRTIFVVRPHGLTISFINLHQRHTTIGFGGVLFPPETVKQVSPSYKYHISQPRNTYNISYYLHIIDQ